MAGRVPSSHLVIESLPLYKKALQSLNLAERPQAGLADPPDELVGENVVVTSSSAAKTSSAGGHISNSELPRAPTAAGLDNLPSFPSSFPSVKRIPGTQFVVDGFRSAGPWSVSYFLSHFHSDHYTGLTNSWSKGLVFCSEITAHLVRDSLEVPDALVVSLALGRTVVIDGCEVTLVDANHCPGAVQFLFRIPGEAGVWQRYVHCGDMRFSPAMTSDTSLCDFVGADAVFLDTTYCNPKFVFPPQQTSVDYVADTIHRLMGADLPGSSVGEASRAGDKITAEGGDGSDNEDDVERYQEEEFMEDSRDESSRKSIVEMEDEDEPVCDGRTIGQVVGEFKAINGRPTLFLISTYVIGKEKILTAVAKRCNCSIYVTEKKLTILKRLDIEEIDVFTTNPAATNVHVVKWSFLGETWPYFRPNFVNMEKIMHEGGYQKVVGFVPTGWTYELKKKTFSVRKKGPFEIHLVPYSEHSNYEELREYVGFLRPKEIIPTVGLEGGGMESKAVATMRKHFRNLVDETASKRNFLKGFSRKLPQESCNVVAPKAIFGRTARKRIRETDEEFAEHQHDLAIVEDINHSRSPKKVSRVDEEKAYLEALETAAMELSEDYLEDGSKPFVSKGRTDSVYTQEEGGLFKAPSKQQGQVHSPQAAIQSRKLTSNQNSLRQSVNLSSSGRSLARNNTTSKRSRGKSQATTKKSPAMKTVKKSSTSPLLAKKVSVSQAPASAAALMSRNQKAMQSSILKFFRKTGEDLNPTQSDPVEYMKEELTVTGNSGHLKHALLEPTYTGDGKVLSPGSIHVQMGTEKWADEFEQLASILDGNLSEKQAYILLERAGGNVGIALDLFYMDQRVGDPSGHSNALVESEYVSPTQSQPFQPAISSGNSGSLNSADLATKAAHDEVCQPETPQLQLEMANWADEYEQLASILSGNLSKEEAYVLLEKAGGDVAIALDYFYRKQSACDISCTPNAVTGSHVDRGKSEVEHTVQVTASSGEDQVRSPQGREEKTSKTPNSVLNSVGARSSLPSAAKKTLDGAIVNNALDKKMSSVAVAVGKYTPLDHACWEIGKPAPYLHLARAFDLIEQESGRLKTADMLCNMFRSLLALSPEAVLPAIYLTTNRIAPDFESGELSIGGSLVTTAIAEATGVSRAKLREMYTALGDLGDVAQACRQTQSSLRLPSPLGICQVFSTLKQISKESGTGSGARKKDLVLSLLRGCREKEMKYIVRTLIQNMRIGAMMKTVLSALAQAVVLHHSFAADQAPDKALVKLKPKFQEASAAVVEAHNFLPNLDVIVPTLIKDGVEGLSANFTISPGTPIKPMLAKITNGIPELLKRFQGQHFTCEYKYDGQRAQIHKLLDGTIRIFTRDSGDATGRFPDVINIVQDAAREDLKSFIIDAEVVAVDRENDNKLMAFQHLSTRERGSRDGSAVSLQNIKVHVGVFVFDIMFANNEPLVKIPFQERRKCMHHWFPNVRPGYFGYASEMTVAAEEDPVLVSQKVQGYLEEAFVASCEGLMAKALVEDSSYMASKRSDSWLKIKRDYVEGLQDSLDLVPIGAWHGNGRKAGWYSPFLLACYDPDHEEYQSVCRVMSGFTDAFYKEITEFYSGDHVLPRKPPYYRTGEEPDVWFTPELVWEIRGAGKLSVGEDLVTEGDFTVSPVHQAAVGLIHPSRGISMRFPRFIRSRPDKKPDIGSSPSDIADLFHKQTRKLEVPGSSAKVIPRPDSPD